MKICVVDAYSMNYNELDMSALEALGEVSYFDYLTPDEIIEKCTECEVMLINKAQINAYILDGCPKLKMIGTLSTGYDRVDVKECARRGIVCCNVPNYSTNSVAQHAFALLLSFASQTPNYINSVAQGDWIKSNSFCYMTWPTMELKGKIFGVIGYGNIGSQTAKIADAFGMKVIILSDKYLENCPFEQVNKAELFKASDVISLHCPLTDDTAELINKDTLAMMKSTAILINTARGGLVDEQALADALNSGSIGGACLDTLKIEPMSEDNPLYGAKNCYITPHVAWIPKETRQRLINWVVDNVKAFIEGAPINVVS